MPFSEIAVLACGKHERHPIVGETLKNIANNITLMENRILNLPIESNEIISLHGPFYGRALLESTCTAIIGRVDPFRLLVIKHVQQHQDFGIESRSNCAIQWNGDIFEKGLADTEIAKMWKSDRKFSDIGRGLFGDYYGKVFWEHAYQSLIDVTSSEIGDDVLVDYRASTEPEDFIKRIRSNSSRLYSSLSKGIHSELVIKSDIIYDRVTVLELLGDTMKICGILGMVSHMIDSCLGQLYLHQALELYRTVKARSDGYGAL